jgi:hypothetical protein
MAQRIMCGLRAPLSNNEEHAEMFRDHHMSLTKEESLELAAYGGNANDERYAVLHRKAFGLALGHGCDAQLIPVMLSGMQDVCMQCGAGKVVYERRNLHVKWKLQELKPRYTVELLGACIACIPQAVETRYTPWNSRLNPYRIVEEEDDEGKAPFLVFALALLHDFCRSHEAALGLRSAET